MSAAWSVARSRGGGAAAPVVSVARRTVRVREIHFATPVNGHEDFHYLWAGASSDARPELAGFQLRGWGRDVKLTVPEYVAGVRSYRACFTRKQPVSMRVKLVTPAGSAFGGTLHVTPRLDGSTAHLQAASAPFSFGAGDSERWIDITAGGNLPDEVGRYILELNWSLSDTSARLDEPRRTRHLIYGIYGAPLDPAYDADATGRRVPRADGTLTGTRQRLDHLMRLIGGTDRRHPVATQDELVDLYWQLHKGINDTPGAPPYFNAENTEHITTGPGGAGTDLPLADQWLAWVPNSSQWNDASCIGHAQLAKTMLAAVGLNARRAWVFPHTKRLPDGTTRTFADTDLYALGRYDPAKEQAWTFTHGARTFRAVAKLMEPGESWENFEACMLSPTGKFLTGGYNTGSNPASFRAGKGFGSAAELLRWWCTTERSGFGRRFMCWTYDNPAAREAYCWDVDGTRYDLPDYVEIRRRGKELPIV